MAEESENLRKWRRFLKIATCSMVTAHAVSVTGPSATDVARTKCLGKAEIANGKPNGSTQAGSSEKCSSVQTSLKEAGVDEADTDETEDLWDRAYKILRTEDSKLVETCEASFLPRDNLSEPAALKPLAKFGSNERAEQLAKVIKEKIKDIDTARWKIQDPAEKFAKGILYFKDAVTSVVQDEPHAALAWAAACLLLPFALNPPAQRSSLTEGLQCIPIILHTFRIYEKHCRKLSDPANMKLVQAFEDTTTTLYTKILAYQMRAHQQCFRSWEVRYVRDVVRFDDWDGSLSEIEKLRDTGVRIVDALGLGRLLENVENIDKRFEKEDEEFKKKETRKALKWLDPDPDVKKDQSSYFKKHQEGTGEWLLHHPSFEEWKNGSLRVLWCHGIPGSGKSVLTSIITDHLQQAPMMGNVLVISKYCHHYIPDQTIDDVLKNLLLQAALESPDAASNVVKIYKRCNLARARPSKEDYITALKEEMSKFSQVYLVIDAVDEFPASYRESMILELCTLCPTLKLLVTSRFEYQSNSLPCKVEQVRILARHEDVVLYLKSKIHGQTESERREMALLRRHCEKNDSLEDRVVETIAGKVHGMFLMAQFLLSFVAEFTNLRDLKEGLERLPEGPKDTYDEAIKRIEGQNAPDCALAFRILKWLTHSLGPLSKDALLHALSIRNGDKDLNPDGIEDPDRIIFNCAGLVILDHEQNTIQLAHLTVREYLTSHGKEKIRGGHELIAESCLTHLSFVSVAQPQVPADSPAYMKKLKARLAKFPFYRYAAEFWAEHVLAGNLEIKLRSHIVAFLESENRKSAAELMIRHWRSSYGRWNHGPYIDHYVENSGERDDGPLHLAAAYGLPQTIKFLIEEHHHDVHSTNIFMQTPLHRAAEMGKTEVVRELITQRSSLTARAEHSALGNPTALFFAINGGHFDATRVLLDASPDDINSSVDAFYEGAMKPLHLASNLSPELVDLLISRNADVNEPNDVGYHCLQFAVRRGLFDVAKKLLEGGANVNGSFVGKFDDWNGSPPPLSMALYHSDQALSTLLLKYEPNITIASELMVEPLWVARYLGKLSWLNIRSVRCSLLEEYAVQLPLHHALWMGNQAEAEKLIDSGQDLMIEDEHGHTPVHYCIYSADIKLIKKAIHRLHQESQLHEGICETCLLEVVNMAIEEVLDMMCNRISMTTKISEEWRTNKSNQVEICRFLLNFRKGTFPQVQDYDIVTRKVGYNKNRLTEAAERGYLDQVQLFFEFGCSISDQDMFGETACHYAAEKGHLDIVRFLVGKDADLDILDEKQRTPLDCAEQQSIDPLLQNYAETLRKERNITA